MLLAIPAAQQQTPAVYLKTAWDCCQAELWRLAKLVLHHCQLPQQLEGTALAMGITAWLDQPGISSEQHMRVMSFVHEHLEQQGCEQQGLGRSCWISQTMLAEPCCWTAHKGMMMFCAGAEPIYIYIYISCLYLYCCILAESACEGNSIRSRCHCIEHMFHVHGNYLHICLSRHVFFRYSCSHLMAGWLS